MSKNKKRKGSNKSKIKNMEIYTAKSNSDGIMFFQNLMNKDPTGKKWISFLNEKDVGFIYDMVASADSFKNFIPSVAQSRKMIVLVNKIKLINKKE